MEERKFTKRRISLKLLAVLLSVMTCFAMTPMSAFAEGVPQEESPAVSEVVTDAEEPAADEADQNAAEPEAVESEAEASDVDGAIELEGEDTKDGEAVSYIKCRWDGSKVVAETKTTTNYIDMSTVSGGTTIGYGNWYVAKGDQTLNGRLTIAETCNLVLCDGATLTAKGGIDLASGRTLNIYAQSDGENCGKLIANSVADRNAAIGGNDGNKGGYLNIHGGKIDCQAGYYGAGIGGGNNADCGTVVIYGGDIKAVGGSQAAGIGGGQYGVLSSSNLVEGFSMYGGHVEARGGYTKPGNTVIYNNGAGIGSGYFTEEGSHEYSGKIGIYGGVVDAYGAHNAAAIGGGYNADGGTITIENATVNAVPNSSQNSGAGIGGGYYGNGGTITIKNSVVSAQGGSEAAGIGGSNHGNGGNVTIINSTVKAYGRSHADTKAYAIGKGSRGNNNGSLHLDEDALVKAGSSESTATKVAKSNRVNAAQNSLFAMIYPCTHENLTYTQIDTNTHRAYCSDCEYEKTEGHEVEGLHCIKCNALLYQVSWDPNNGDPIENEFSIPEPNSVGGYYPWEVTVRPAPANAPEGKIFSSWEDPTGNTHQPGQPIMVSESTVLKAIWAPEYIVTYDPNNGIDEPYTVPVEGVMDSEGNPIGAGFMTEHGPQNHPEGKQFIGWKKSGDDTLYGENDFVWIEENTTLTAQWSDYPSLTVKGVTLDGVITDITSLTYPCDASTRTIESILSPKKEEIIDYFTEQIPDGYAVFTDKPFIPNLLSTYDRYRDMPSSASNSNWWKVEVTDENNTVYVPIVKLVDEIDIPVKAPVCGDQTITQRYGPEPNPYRQTERPELTIKDDDPFFIYNDKGDGTQDCWVIDPESEDVTEGSGYSDWGDTYIMTFRGDKSYTASVYIEFKTGYLFPDDGAAKINGTIVENPDSDRGYIIGLRGNVSVDHVWDDGEVTLEPTPTEPGVETFTCTGCDATKEEPIPATGYEPGEDPDQMGEDGTPVGPGASAVAADNAITSITDEKDPKGSVFAKLKLKSPSQTKTSIKLSWTNMSKAEKYVLYGNKCGKSYKLKNLGTVTKNYKTIKDINGKKLVKGKYYKFIIVALDENNSVVSTSKIIHVATTGGSVGNHKSVTVPKTVITKAKKIKAGKALGLKAKANKKSKTVKKHIGLRYESTNKDIATVTSKGYIKGKSAGKCYVYAYAQNGVYKRVAVTVK